MIHINIFKDNDNDYQYILATKEDCSAMLQAIEDCFVYDDARAFLNNLIECNAPQRLIDYVRTKQMYLSESIYDFTVEFLIDIDLLELSKVYEFYY